MIEIENVSKYKTNRSLFDWSVEIDNSQKNGNKLN